MSAGETVLAQRRFCNRCGSPMPVEAPTCGRCGAPQTGDAASPATASGPVAARKVNGLAIASLVLGILWFGWLGSILAIIFGHIAHGQIRDAQGRQSGGGMATAGLVLGYIGIATLIAVIALGLISSIISMA